MLKTPEMIPGTVETVSVEWLLKNLEHAADLGSLDDENALSNLVEYKCDYRLARALPAVLEDGFLIPIAISQSVSYGISLGNGHHRFVAAILICAPEILVYWSYDDGLSVEDFENTTGDDHDVSDHKYARTVNYGKDEWDWAGIVSEARKDFISRNAY